MVGINLRWGVPGEGGGIRVFGLRKGAHVSCQNKGHGL